MKKMCRNSIYIICE